MTRSNSRTHGAAVRDARPVTRADVARLAGVSSAVVSYVVNDGPRPVATATAQRVREAMELLGYRPNASARALRTGTTDTIGLVLGDSRNPFFTEYTFELVKGAAARGYHVLISDAQQYGQGDPAALVDALVARQVDGLLFAAPHRGWVRGLSAASDVPFVLVDAPGALPGVCSVGSAARAGAAEVTAHLLEHGRRHIALLIGEEGFGDPDPRDAGWLSAHLEAGVRPGPQMRTTFTREGGHLGTLRLLQGNEPVDAIFATNDLQAIGALRALREQGCSVPGDIALVSYDGTVEAEFAWPPLTVARQNVQAMASAALDLLAEPQPSAGRHIKIATQLILRASCGCPATTAAQAPEHES